jgi:hypothetical protein
LIGIESELGGLRWDNVSLGMLWAQEYERLKEEQAQRIATRDNLMYATLVSIAGVIFAMDQTHNPDLLLLLPPGCVVLGWTYLVNDEKISAIGRYIRTDLGPRLATLLQSAEPVYGWEVAHRSDRRRRTRKLTQLFVDLMTFCLPGAGAIVARCLLPGLSPFDAVIAAAEGLLVLVLAQQIMANADLTRDQAWSETDATESAVTRVRD